MMAHPISALLIVAGVAFVLLSFLAGCVSVERTPQQECQRAHRNACDAVLFEKYRDSMKVGVYDVNQLQVTCMNYARIQCPALP